MFQILANIFSWIVQALTDVINMVLSVPKYISFIRTIAVRSIPPWMVPYIIVMITVLVILGIKRMVL